MIQFAEKAARQAAVEKWQAAATLQLLAEGATIPFISRYRKEKTGNLDEVQIMHVRDIAKKLEAVEERREAILQNLSERELLTPELKQGIMTAEILSELEDIYLPFRQKRKTRASVAKEKGLEGLAKIIMAENTDNPDRSAQSFVDPAKGVNNVEEAIEGAMDIIAEWISESRTARAKIRNLYSREAVIAVTATKNAAEHAEAEKYLHYADKTEQLRNAPSHRLLAIFRGETEKVLKVAVNVPEDKALQLISQSFLKGNNACSEIKERAIRDAFKRLLAPSIETEMRAEAKERADVEAIRVFSDNLRQLLLAPPLGEKRTLGIDPGFRTGCKIVCLDNQGNLLHNETIFPHAPQNEWAKAKAKIYSLIGSYKIEAIAIGNGTAGRETENLIRQIALPPGVKVFVVSENGASIYSASAVAREEFPEYDVTVRGSVSIGRRLMDPLAELVKIDPKSIGVGQYQHDVDQKLLKESLDEVVMSCVNSVGVDVNTASPQLLSYVSGLGPSLAANIVEYRKKNGPFTSRKKLLKVPRLGEKAFEQCAGFMKIRDGENPLDSSAVHPEAYPVVERMAKSLKCTLHDLLQNGELRRKIKLEDYVSGDIGMPTLTDIMSELEKPGRDPRKQAKVMEFDKNVRTISDLQVGMELMGIVTNVTAFGAFVDVGIKENGLVHISQIADAFVSDPSEFVKLHQHVKVKVLEIDIPKKRISLSMKGMS
ncbi:MAG: RNA-binding transcriptional accessory protein [Bacteroidetes bacterium]|nr:RNA-binding transcriptional accessory protein [Bacteroidota bacterium]MBU1718215.1 RNA-binding transcriptional accessory protein [Bacteroidota bacterium]